MGSKRIRFLAFVGFFSAFGKLFVELIDRMHSLNPNEDKYESNIVKHNPGCDGHLALDVYTLVLSGYNCQLENGIEVDSKGDNQHQNRRSTLNMWLIFVPHNTDEDGHVYDCKDYSDDDGSSRSKKSMNVFDESLADYIWV